MENTTIIFLAMFMGLATVDLFGGFWLSVLGVAATLILRCRELLVGKRFWLRLQGHVVRMVLFGGTLLGVLVLYCRHMGLGMSEQESMAYLIGAVVRMFFLARSVRERIDELFYLDD